MSINVLIYSQNNDTIVLSVDIKMPWWDGKSNLAYIMLFMNTAFANVSRELILSPNTKQVETI